MGQLERRKLLIGAGCLLASGLATAQSPASRVRTIGFLTLHALDPKFPPSEYPTTKALRKLGWVEGQNIVIERRFAEYRTERLAEFAQELVRKRVELIITVEDAPALAAARATKTIPIVFVNMGYPLERGLVDSLARPGRNVTGTTWLAGPTQTQAKRIELLREIAPGANRVLVLSAPVHFETLAAGGSTESSGASLSEQSRRLGIETRRYPISKAEDVDAALAEALAWKANAILGAGAIVEAARDRVAEFALRHKLPSAFMRPLNVEAGGLLSYSITREEYLSLLERGMEYVDRILRGANPGDLPVVQPTRFELVINLKTARALGLKVPQSLLVRADRVIE